MKNALCFIVSLGLCSAVFAGEFVFWNGNEKAKIAVSQSEPEYLKLAVGDLAGDAKKVGGVDLKIENFSDAGKASKLQKTLFVGSVDNPDFRALLEKLGVDAKSLRGKRESFALINTGENSFVAAGSDARGAMFAVYELCEKYLGVEPLGFFSGLEPQPKKSLALKNVKYFSKEPTVKYRGWFINDEDFISEFYPCDGRRNIDYAFYNQVVSPKLMAKIVEALVRAKFNMIIPASFMDVANPAEEALLREAVKRGVYISAHHIEPMGVSGYTFFNYFKAKGEKDSVFSYFTSPEKMVEVWRSYAQKWAQYPDVIWQIGLRGVGDRPMWFADKRIPQSDAERGRIISEAIAKQVAIVSEFDKRKNPPMTTTLWGEGATLFELGYLKIPDGVMIVFSDNSPGWKMQADFEKIAREPNREYGIYYHHQLWGCGPHMAHAVPPARTRAVLKSAIDKRSAEYVIMNVSNVREFVMGIETSAKMLFDFASVGADGGLSQFTSEWFPDNAEKIAEAYNAYYNAFSIHEERHTPFWLDGQLCSEINSNFREVRRSTVGEKALALKMKHDASPNTEKPKTEMTRFVKEILGDAYPDKKTFQYRLGFINSQLDDFRAVTSKIEALANSLPAREREFLRTNLLSHSEIMTGYSELAKYSVLARIALGKGELEECMYNLRLAQYSLSPIEKGMDINSRGKWKDWYRGDKKMNLPRTKLLLSKATENLERLMQKRADAKEKKSKK